MALTGGTTGSFFPAAGSRHDLLHAHADRIGIAAARTVDATWQELWAQMRPGPAAAAENYQRAAVLLAELPTRVYRELWAGLGGLLHWAHGEAGQALLRRLPSPALRQLVARRMVGLRPASLLEAGALEFGAGNPFAFTRNKDRKRVLVNMDVDKLDAAWSKDWGYIPRGGGGAEIPGRREAFQRWLQKGEAIEAPRVVIDDDGTVSFVDGRHRFAVLRDMGVTTIPVLVERRQARQAEAELGATVGQDLAGPLRSPSALPREEQRALFQQMLFPPLPQDRVNEFLASMIPEAGWGRIGDTRTKISPQELASIIAQRYAAGESTRKVAQAVLPYFDGSRVRATRAARTFGAYVGTAANLEAAEQLGDLVQGYEVTDPGGPTARPDHLRRSGTRYWRRPKRGQWGLDVMPQPPLDRGGPYEDGTGVKWNCRCWLSPIITG